MSVSGKARREGEVSRLGPGRVRYHRESADCERALGGSGGAVAGWGVLPLALGLLLFSAGRLGAEDALKTVADIILGRDRDEELVKAWGPVMSEVTPLIQGDADLRRSIESQGGMQSVQNALVWAAARSVHFDPKAFSKRFPHLAAYEQVVLVSRAYSGVPRVVYVLPNSLRVEPRMLYGDSREPVQAEVAKVERWEGEQGMEDWDGRFSFAGTARGPYVYSTAEGRLTTGATGIRHILRWYRIEATRVVPERCEAYMVPTGEKREPKDLTNTAYAAVRVAGGDGSAPSNK